MSISLHQTICCSLNSPALETTGTLIDHFGFFLPILVDDDETLLVCRKQKNCVHLHKPFITDELVMGQSASCTAAGDSEQTRQADQPGSLAAASTAERETLASESVTTRAHRAPLNPRPTEAVEFLVTVSLRV